MPLRPSRYAVVSPTVFRHPSGQVVRPVLNTRTGRVHLADLPTAAHLAGESPPVPEPGPVPESPPRPPSGAGGPGPPRPKTPRPDPAPSGEVTPSSEADLVAAGLLVETGRDEAAEVLAEARAVAGEPRSREFVVMPSAYCNMGCGYCGQTHERVTVSGAHRSALIDRVRGAAGSGRYDAVRVRWFGGEPLMAYAVLKDLSRHFVAAADEAGISYTAKVVTNGVLLDARKLRALHRECRVGELEITLDGPAEAHDVTRPLKSGGRSFDRIVATIGAALDDPELAGLRFVIRTNISVHNVHLAEPFAAALAAAGLAHDRVGCYPAPVHSWSNDVSGVAVGREELAGAELRWLLAYQRHGLRHNLLPAPRPFVCTATTRHSEVISADGKVYSCTEQPLVPALRDREVARLGLPGLRPAGDFDDWYDTAEAGETGCRACELLPVCGGACPKLWRDGKPPCPPLRDNLRHRLDLYTVSAGYRPQALPQEH